MLDSAGLLEAAVRVLADKPIPKVPDVRFNLDSMCAGTLKLYEDLVGKVGEKTSTISGVVMR